MSNRSRFWWLLLLVASLFSLLAARLFDVQLIQGEQFRVQAENNRFFTLPLVADRGIVLDRFGQPLVLNARWYAYIDNPTQLFSPSQTLDRSQGLALLATGSAHVTLGAQREYPYGPVLAHTLGYVGAVTADDIKTDPALKPYHVLGKLGLEKVADTVLRGVDGSQTFEVNARMERQRETNKVDPVVGKNVQSTLDPYISQVAYDALGSARGSVIVSDARTGEILALVNNPSFDPNIFSQTYSEATSSAERQQKIVSYFSDSTQPMFNRALQGAYPPGSIFKLVTAIAGLEKGAIDTKTTVLDEGILKVGEYEYGNWYFSQYGRTEGEIALQRAISRSNDIYFYKTAEWVGPDALAQFAKLFGFGQVTGVALGAEAAGLVPTPEWKEQRFGERWFLGNTYHFGIGQGDLLVTPLQVAQMGQIIANEGQKCTPAAVKNETMACSSVGVTLEHLKMVLAGMLDACSPGGTAYPLFPINAERRQAPDQVVDQADQSTASSHDPYTDLQRGSVACKTGTAEFGGADERGYRKTHGWWIGIVEPRYPKLMTQDELASLTDSSQKQWIENIQKTDYPPRIVITVLVESDDEQPFREGSRDAASVGKQVLDWMEGRSVKPVVVPVDAQGE